MTREDFKQIREEMGLSHGQLGKMSGLPSVTLKGFEENRFNLSPEYISKLEERLQAVGVWLIQNGQMRKADGSAYEPKERITRRLPILYPEDY